MSRRRQRLFLRSVPQSEVQKVLDWLQIRHFDEDIMDMSLDELRRHFGERTTDGMRMTILIRNIIWQLYEQIQAGNLPDFYKRNEFVRSLWYYIKKLTTQHKSTWGNHYGLVCRELQTMVEAGLFTYQDFNFRDTDADKRVLGLDNPHIILIAEKDSFMVFLREIAAMYGIHVLTLGGNSSFLSTNTFVSELAKRGLSLDGEYYVFAIVDFDPAGMRAAQSFVAHLTKSGLKNLHSFRVYLKPLPWLDLCHPGNLEDAQRKKLRDVCFALPRKIVADPATVKWAHLTGGVNGKGDRKWGIESDEFSDARLRELLAREIVPYLHTPVEVVRRRNTMASLKDTLTRYMVARILLQQTSSTKP